MQREFIGSIDNTILHWIEKWYKNNCNGDWEHSYGIRIRTQDNPGWRIEIDIMGTPYQKNNIEYKLYEASENDWYGYKVENSVFVAAGDPDKLVFLLELFKAFVEKGYLE